MKLTCRSCQHSIGSYPGSPLICTRNMQPVPAIPCDEFCYEPGTDEEETMEDVEEVPKSNGMWMLVEDAIALCDEAVAKEREAYALHCDEIREQAVMSKYATQRDCQTARRAMEQCSAAIRMRSNGEVRGASRLAGEASSAEGATSTVVLGAERPGKD